MPSHRVNLVFQGGGVRGIAYVGVLSTMPPDLQVTGVGGTSAGALVAALLAIGKRGDELKDILSDPGLFNLLRAEDVQRKERIVKAWHKYEPKIRDLVAEGGIKAPTAIGYLLSRNERSRVAELKLAGKELKEISKDLLEIWKQRGIHSSEPLRKWLDKVLDDKKFGDLKKISKDGIRDLRIVTADITEQKYQVFSPEEHSDTYLAAAVHASTSIPVFFSPFVTSGGTQTFVDGGILSNYPSFLFAQSPHPTIGFRLEDVPPLTRIKEVESAPNKPIEISSSKDFLLLILKTMAEAHDKFRELPPDFHSYRVPVPDDIPFDKFDLSRIEADRLYDKGATLDVKWDEDSIPSEKPRTFDPKPQHALGFAIEQGASLERRYYSKPMWAESLTQDVGLDVFIEQDWSSRYVRMMTLKVVGAKPIFLMRVRAWGLPKGSKSLADHVPVYEELDGGVARTVVLLPTSNEDEEKGFIALMDPPLQNADPPRKFKMEWRIKAEFAEVEHGKPGLISYAASQLAENHRLKVVIRVLIDHRLGEIAFKPENIEKFEGSGLHEGEEGRIYRVYTSSTSELPVGGKSTVQAYFRRI